MFEVNTATQISPEPPISDMRVKRDIVPVGELENGLTLYRFKYNWGEREFVGVMAQDVLKVHPDAVSVTENGLYDVDYTMIGAKFMTYENWLQQSKQSPLERMQAATVAELMYQSARLALLSQDMAPASGPTSGEN